jgi:hypothetical protein
MLALSQALADYQKRSLIIAGVPASVLPKIPKVQRLAAGMGGPGGRGGGRGGEFRRSGSTGTFGGRQGAWTRVCTCYVAVYLSFVGRQGGCCETRQPLRYVL